MPLPDSDLLAVGGAGRTVAVSSGVDFRFPPQPGVTGVRLEVDFPLPGVDLEFSPDADGWSLQVPRPAVDRLEYHYTVRRGLHSENVTDPTNPAIVANPFGAKSELRFPEYREPEWLAGPVTGSTTALQTPIGQLDEPVPVTLWSPDGLDVRMSAPLLLVHDGSDLAERGSLLRWATVQAHDQPFRVALLDPAAGRRDQWYAADPRYADHLAEVLLPAICAVVAVGPVVGLGASLGALAMMTVEHRHPGLLDGLALQSGSFFTAQLDPQEDGYGPFGQICAAVWEIVAGPAARPGPVLVTCGTVEENLGNNQQLAAALTALGYRVTLSLFRDAHTMIGWRDAWSPGLGRLLLTVGAGGRPAGGGASMTRTEYHQLDAPSLGGSREIAVHGHWGRPVLWFPGEAGDPWEFEANGMLAALGPAIDDGRLTVFCVPSYDLASWANRELPQGERARAHRRFEDWIIWRVVPFIRDSCGGRDDIVTAGPSMGAFHAVLFALRHAHVFGRAVGFSGGYEPWDWHGWGDSDQDTYLTDPMQFLPRTYGGHLDFLRSRLYLTLVVGSGQWEDTTGANASTRALAGLLADKQIPHELYVWGDQWPHDWPSWRAQAAVYLPQLG